MVNGYTLNYLKSISTICGYTDLTIIFTGLYKANTFCAQPKYNLFCNEILDIIYSVLFE